jgi:hypothetical protein
MKKVITDFMKEYASKNNQIKKIVYKERKK